jgi:imidazole glycerol-phosphate synthase subunit HisF
VKRIRVIPVLLLAQAGMVKTKGFAKPAYLGDPINAVKIFNEKMADELLLLDIEATAKRTINFEWIEDIVSEAFMPIAYGGGLTSMEQCAQLFERGVEKVVINTAAVERPELISEVAARFGSQAVVVSIDAKRNLWGRWRAYVRGAKKETKFSPTELAKACTDLGAGEVFLTSVEREGSFSGYDLGLTRAVADVVDVPVIAHGGAGQVAHFVEAVSQGGASAVAAGSMFVFAAKGEGMLISYPAQSELETRFWEPLAA